MKKLLSLLAIATLAGSLLVACGGTETSTTTPDTPSVSTPSAEGTEADTEAVSEDLSGVEDISEETTDEMSDDLLEDVEDTSAVEAAN